MTQDTGGVALLEVEDLTVRYEPKLGDGLTAVDGVSFTLGRRRVVALIGPNGSGKSSLIRALLGAAPATGTVRWFDRRLRDWPRRQLARRVAYLPQAPTADPGQTVADVLRLGRTPYGGPFGLESRRDAAVVPRWPTRSACPT